MTTGEVNEHSMVRIRIEAFPLALYDAARQHSEALMREFAFIAEGDGERAGVPVRLFTLVDELRQRFGTHNTAAEALIDDAVRRGEESITFELQVPIEARQAVLDLGAQLDEADEFCRNGDLLTLATPAEIRAFRAWCLDEVVRQLDGRPPTAWPEWRAAAPQPT